MPPSWTAPPTLPPAPAPAFPSSMSLDVMSPEGQQQIDVDLESMSDELAKQLLVQYAHIIPTLGQVILDKSHELRLKETRTRRSYRSFVRETDYLINKKHRRLRCSQQFEIAGEVQGEIEEMLRTMTTEVQTYSTFESKYSALESMLQIFETVMGSGSELGSEVQKDCFEWDGLFMELFGVLTPEDRARLTYDQCSASRSDTWLDRLTGFVEVAESYCFMEGVGQACDILKGEMEEQQNEDEDEDEDDEGAEHER
ncbi:hypothetical protein PG984_012019 [Apiospora sp. TS-2023a]